MEIPISSICLAAVVSRNEYVSFHELCMPWNDVMFYELQWSIQNIYSQQEPQ